MDEHNTPIRAPVDPAGPDSPWRFRLYLAGDTPAGEAARCNLMSVCDRFLAGRYALEIIDLLEDSAGAEADRIFAVPTVIRLAPGPPRKVIGDLSDQQKVLAGLNIPIAGPPGDSPPDPE